MTGRIRVEVTDRHGTVAEIIDPAELRLSPRKRARAETLADELVRGVAAILGCDEDHARFAAAAELMRLIADEKAYERVCQQKGLLPL